VFNYIKKYISNIKTTLEDRSKKGIKENVFITSFYYAVIVGIVAGIIHWLIHTWH
jgi:hypothetical protein